MPTLVALIPPPSPPEAAGMAYGGMLGEGYAELSDLAKRKPWDYGEI